MRRRNHCSRLFGCLLLACAAAQPAYAQAQAQQAGDVFPADYFRDASPANAADMLERVPGFTLVEADADVRGYAGAAGNVLVDGVRPTSKREDTGQQLQRIPASAVARIELIHAGTAGIDMGGYPVLANVVLRHESSTEGAIETGVFASTDGWAAAQAALQYAWRRDGRALELAFEQAPELDDDTGRGAIREHDAGAAQDTVRSWDTRTTKRKRLASIGWRQPFAGGQLSLDAALRGKLARTDTAIGASADGERIDEDEDSRERELGIRYGVDFGARTHLDAMATRQRARLDEGEASREGDDSERYGARTDSGETIGRIELTHARNAALSFNAWLEGAANFLQGESRLEQAGVVVQVPGSSVRVEEQREEASAGLTWRPRPAWSLEAGMRFERSTLSQTGDHARSRRFAYPKPNVALRWTPNTADDWRLAIAREVGQLDFGDFVASASLEGGTVTAGNAELRPEQSWNSELRWEHRFKADAALTLAWNHDDIADVVDRVLVVDGADLFDAPGNIGDGRRDTLSANLSAPLDRWGLRGVRLRATALWRDSAVTDPVSGQSRRISGEQPFEGELELTHELPALGLNWGVQIEHIAERETGYRHDRITHESEGMGWTLFAERRLGERWRVRTELTDLFGRGFHEDRYDYAGTRASGVLEGSTLRERRTPGTISLTIRRTMGD